MGPAKNLMIRIGNSARLVWLIVVFAFEWLMAGLSVVLSSSQPDDLPRKTKRPAAERRRAG